METKLTLKLNDEGLDKELREWVSTKLRHIAKGNVEVLIDDKYRNIITKEIEKELKKQSYPYSKIESMVKKFVENKVNLFLFDDYREEIRNSVKQMVKEEVEKCFAETNFDELIDKSIKENIESEAYKAAKEKLKGIFD